MSKGSSSSGRAFYVASTVLVAALLVGVLVLALLVSTSGPRVRHVVVDNREGYGGVGVVDQGLTVLFDRPVETADLESVVSIRPEAGFTATQNGQQLDVTFDQNLLSDTEYVLTVGPALTDGTGRRMERAYTYEFATAEPVYTYLRRDYGPGTLDEIIGRAPLSGQQRTLFEAERITRFARNDDHLAAVLPQEEGGDELRVVPLGAGQEDKTVDLPPGARIDDVQFSPTEDQFVFVARSAPGSENRSGRRPAGLYSYDIGDERLMPVDTSDGEGVVEDALYSRDGQALLFGTADGTYYLTGVAQTTEPIRLGDYEASGGFDRTGTRISFETASGGLAVYDARRDRLAELPLAGAGMVTSAPSFLHNSNALIYRQDFVDRRSDVTLSEIDVAYPDGKVEKQITALYPAVFFDEPAISQDDRYVLVETSRSPAERDGYAGNEQPKDAYLSLYDRFDGVPIEEVRGIDPVWSS